MSAAPLLDSSWFADPGGWMTAILSGLPAWGADPHVIGFIQSFAVAIGLAGSVVLLRRLLVPDLSGWLGQALLTLVVAVAGRWLVGTG